MRACRFAAFATVLVLAVAPRLAAAGVTFPGPPVYVYKLNANGTTTPGSQPDAATFNAQATVLGSATPPNAALLGSASTYGGNNGTVAASLDITQTAYTLSGTTIILSGSSACGAAFTYTNGNGTTTGCVAASGSTASNVNALVAVQSWPFYIGAIGSSNLGPGAYTFETATDDGSYVVVAPAAFTYAQPANFGGATGLTAGTAVLSNGVAESVGTRGGTATFAVQSTCASNLYYETFEYEEILGGGAYIGYFWQLPGSAANVSQTQSVVYGRVIRNGAPASGDTVTIALPTGGTATETTDANGCYGYNYASYAGSTTASVTVNDTVVNQSYGSSTALPAGNAQRFDFVFPQNPSVQLYKEITQVATYGPTPGPTTTPRVIVPTPDPTNPPGVAGTSNFLPGVYPRDIITYTVFFGNYGGNTALGAGKVGGPTFSDALAAPLTYKTGSQTFACCVNPTSTNSATFSLAGQTLQWTLANGLSPFSSSSTPIEGTFSFQATVK